MGFFKNFFELLNEFYCIYNCTQSSQPNFIVFPSQTLSASSQPPTCLIWKVKEIKHKESREDGVMASGYIYKL